MPFSRKEKKQVMILGALMVVGLLILGYVFRDKLLPAPIKGSDAYAPAQRLEIPSTEAAEDLFKRDDYKNLHQFGNVPVTAAPTTSPVNPFAVPGKP